MAPHRGPTLPGTGLPRRRRASTLERERVFARSWVCVGRGEQPARCGRLPGGRESPASRPIVRARRRRAAARVRERAAGTEGTELLSGRGLDGARDQVPVPRVDILARRATCRLAERRGRDGIDRDSDRVCGQCRSPSSTASSFVNLDSGAAPLLEEVVAAEPDSPLELGAIRRGRAAGRRPARSTTCEAELEDRGRELPRVPALPDGAPRAREDRAAVPARRGRGGGPATRELDGGGVHLVHRERHFDACRPLPGIDEVDLHTFYGVYVFPNLILNYHSETGERGDDLIPVAPDRTRVGERVPASARDRSEADGFDAQRRWWSSATLVANQDWRVCEAVATWGVVPLLHGRRVPAAGTWINAFNGRYLDARGPLPS